MNTITKQHSNLIMNIQQALVAWDNIQTLRKAKDFDAALQAVEDLIGQGCISSDLLEVRAILILMADQEGTLFPELTLEIAKSSLEAAISISRNPVGALVELGYYKYAMMVDCTHEALGHFNEAEQNAMSGVKDALIGQAKCFLDLGARSKANIILKRLKAMFPDDEDSKIMWLEFWESF